MSYMQTFMPPLTTGMFPGNPSPFSVKSILNLAEQQPPYRGQTAGYQQGLPMDSSYYCGLQEDCMLPDPGSMPPPCDYTGAPNAIYPTQPRDPHTVEHGSVPIPVTDASNGTPCSFHPDTTGDINIREIGGDETAPTTNPGR